MNQLQATGQLVRDTFLNWAQMRNMSPQAIDQMAHLIGDEYAFLPGGDIYIGGQFTRCRPEGQAENIAQWNSEGWATIGGGTFWLGYHLPCLFCGNSKIPGSAASCSSCGAPTATWWTHLDQMLADWKRGLAG